MTLLKKRAKQIDREKYREIGDILRRARNSQDIIQEAMARKCSLGRSTISSYESGAKLPDTKDKALNLIKCYGLNYFEAETVIKILFPSNLLTQEDWNTYGSPRESLYAPLDPRIAKHLSETLSAKRINKNHQNHGWTYSEPTPVSALLTHFSADYTIKDDGYMHQVTRFDLYQLTSKQYILTPLFIDPITRKTRITWNGSDQLQLNKVREQQKPASFLGEAHSNTIYYEGVLDNLSVGDLNSLVVEVESRLCICDLGGDSFALCTPFFYALDPSRINIKLPNGLVDREFYLLKRDIESNKITWHPDPQYIHAQEENGKLFLLLPTPETDLINKKRFCPDLLIIKFKRNDGSLLPSAIILGSNKERPIRIAWSFFCGKKDSCPASELTQP